ncbi:hypothetical protein [Flavobacterium sp.]|uniref:hypothetical protein n=1 Tax=Flavobacterium sp. TaxID=239 RepID=UPI001229E6A1|nr:hypothetical protein [Flavobacterium sp.]RZJ73285.1 MAG: hypothetical protein EOO49_02970 [Flavobacterium sp.]
MSAIISYKKHLSFWKILLGVLCGLFAVFLLVSNNPIGFIFWVCVGVSALRTNGAELDLNSKMYRETKFVVGIKFGNWKPNPAFDYVSVFTTKETQTVRYASISTDVSANIIVLNVFYGNKHITFFSTTDKSDAFAKAKHIATALNIDVLDATSRDKVWLDQNLVPIQS